MVSPVVWKVHVHITIYLYMHALKLLNEYHILPIKRSALVSWVCSLCDAIQQLYNGKTDMYF